MYLPILQGDREGSVPAAMKRLPDSRVIYFWDGKGELSQGYSRSLKFTAGQPAWDMYLLFNRETEWKNELPLPDYWMHQLYGQPPEQLLNGQKLAEETKKLLQPGK